MKLIHTFRQSELGLNYRAIIAAFTMAFFAWGMIFYAHGVFKVVLEEKHGWSSSFMSLAQSWFWFVGAISAFAVGAMIDRYGARTVAYYGVCATAVGLVSISLVYEPWQLFLAFFILATAYPTIGNLGISAALAPIFEVRYAAALSFALTGASVGGAIVTPAFIFLTKDLGFELASWVLAIATLLVLSPILLWLPSSTPSKDLNRDVEEQEVFRNSLCSPVFWVIFLTGLFSFTGQVGFLFQEISIFQPRMGLENAGYAVSLTVVGAAFGRFILGWTAELFQLRLVAAAVYLVQAAGLFIAILFEGVLTSYIAAFIIGLAVGPVVMLPAMLIRGAFGPKAFGKMFGLASIGMFAGMMIGPSITGITAASFGFEMALLCLLASDVVAAILIFLGFKKSDC